MLVMLALASCSITPAPVGDTLIYPDYQDVTVPCNIAPLNFRYNVGDRRTETTFSAGDVTVKFKGAEVVWNESEWHELLAKAAGGDISVQSSVGGNWNIHVSEDTVDPYLTYRLIEPGYEVWHEVEIVERNVTNYDEKVISDYRHTNNACMNCHIHGQNRGDYSIFYVRGKNGGAMLNRNGELRKLNLRNSSMISGTVYGELHPSGSYGVFSTNIIIPGFHTVADNRLEVYDTASDLVVADFDHDRIISSPLVSREDVLETFPVFSPDGEWVYFCRADVVKLPEDIEKLHYDICRIAFDASKGMWGSTIETVWSSAEGGSACHPKVSPDGRWLMFTVADYGTFPIWHRECDLKMMDLQTGEMYDLAGANSDRSETFHSWSSDSRWFVFASKRGDGQYGKPYFCHIDENGVASKPFVLPQADPYFYEETTRSFNIPDLSSGSVGFDAETIGRMCDQASENFD